MARLRRACYGARAKYRRLSLQTMPRAEGGARRHAHAERAPGALLARRQILSRARGVQETLQAAADAGTAPGVVSSVSLMGDPGMFVPVAGCCRSKNVPAGGCPPCLPCALTALSQTTAPEPGRLLSCSFAN